MCRSVALDVANEVAESQIKTVEEYLALKAQAEQIETRLKEIKAIIEGTIPVGGTYNYGGRKVSLTECIRENFQLKAARLLMPAEVLAPFVTLSVYTQLRVK